MTPDDRQSGADNVIHLRTTPQSGEAERVVLGSVIICPEVLEEPALSVLQPGDFYSDKHGVLWGLLQGMRDRGTPIDPTSVVDRISETGQAADCGGLAYVISLPDEVPSIESAGYYARIVHQRSTMRLARQRFMELVELSTQGDVDLPQLQSAVENAARAVEGRATGEDWQPVSDVVASVYETIEDRAARGGEEPGLPCGALSRLVRAKPGQMVVLAARPAMGKTGLALEWAELLAGAGHGVGYVSAEMPPPDLQLRRIAKRAQLDAWKVEKGLVHEGDMGRIRDAAAALSGLPLWYTDAPGLTVEAVRSRIYALQRRADRAGTPLSVVFVDHIGKLRGQPRMNNYEAQSHISNELSALALRTGLCIVALAQLNRAVEKRSPPRPQLSDLRESGKIEEDARCVLMLYRPEYYDEDTVQSGMGEVIVAKQNGGATGSLWLPWQGHWGSYDMTIEADPRGAQWGH